MNDTINQVGAGAPAAWTKTKPAAPGAYRIRGEGLIQRPALVEVVSYEGTLWCNLHMRNTDPEFGYGFTVAQLDEGFEWLGPLSPAAPVVQAERYGSYVTTPGESVAGIAARQLGDQSRWIEIRDLNALEFPDMGPHDYYPVGTKLVMPKSAPPAQPDASVLVEALLMDAVGVTSGLIAHEYNGSCPDAVNGHDKRDEDCPACQVVLRIEAAMAAKEVNP